MENIYGDNDASNTNNTIQFTLTGSRDEKKLWVVLCAFQTHSIRDG